MESLISFFTNDYAIHLMIYIGIYLILAQSFNLSFGMGGLLNLAHISVYAIGAYTTALLSTDHGWPFAYCIGASMVLSGLFAFLIGAISLKLSTDYFAIGTLAFSSVVTALLINWKSLTRGVLGIPGIPRPDFYKVDFYQNKNFLFLTYITVVFVQFFLYCVFKSNVARALKSQSENEYAAQSLAKNTSGIRNRCFVISSIFAGLAGSLFAYYINYIDPSSFGLHEMVFVLSIVIIGKPGSFWGCIFATIFLVLLPEPLRFVNFSPSVVGPMRQLLYAVVLFGVVYWKKESLFPVERSV